MIKVFSMLKRRPDMTLEAFHKWWLEEHVPYAMKLPGVRRYKVCLVKGSTTHPEADLPWDGIAETWWDDRAALERAWTATTDGSAAVAHSYANVSERMTLIAEEHEFIP